MVWVFSKTPPKAGGVFFLWMLYFWVVRYLFITLSFVLLTATGCNRQSSASTELTGETQAVDIPSYEITEVEVKKTALELVDKMFGRPWRTDFENDSLRKPVVAVGEIELVGDYDPKLQLFIDEVESGVINAGLVRIVELGDYRNLGEDDLIHEKVDLLLSGTAKSESSDNHKYVIYRYRLSLTNLRSGEQVWEGEKEVQKLLSKK